jgi:hypothetical protein
MLHMEEFEKVGYVLRVCHPVCGILRGHFAVKQASATQYDRQKGRKKSVGTLFGACRNYISTISEPNPSPKSVAGVTLRDQSS